jgi:hypothetical protein
VHGERVPDHLRHNRRPPRPRLDHFLVASRAIHHLDLLEKVKIHERAFLE